MEFGGVANKCFSAAVGFDITFAQFAFLVLVFYFHLLPGLKFSDYYLAFFGFVGYLFTNANLSQNRRYLTK